MAFVASIVVVLLALVGLAFVGLRLASGARRVAAVRSAVTTDVTDRYRTIVARTAALRVRLHERRT